MLLMTKRTVSAKAAAMMFLCWSQHPVLASLSSSSSSSSTSMAATTPLPSTLVNSGTTTTKKIPATFCPLYQNRDHRRYSRRFHHQQQPKYLSEFRRFSSIQRCYFSNTLIKGRYDDTSRSSLSSLPTSDEDGINQSSNDFINSLTSSDTQHLPRIYVDTAEMNSSFSNRSIIPLTKAQENYLNVMRITNPKRWGKLAGHFRIFNGKDGEWIAKLLMTESSNKKKRKNSGGGGNELSSSVMECVKRIREQQQQISSSSSPLHGTKVHLYIGRCKKPRRKWILEKVTELGVDEIHIIDTEYASLGDIWEYNKHRLHVIEASEQCERLTVPYLSKEPIQFSPTLLDIISQSLSPSSPSLLSNCMDKNDSHNDKVDGDDASNNLYENHQEQQQLWLVCRERSPNSIPLLKLLQHRLASSNNDDVVDDMNGNGSFKTEPAPLLPSSIHILVGPEGGWSPKELDVLDQLMKRDAHVTAATDGSSSSSSNDETTKRNANNLFFVSLGSLVLRAETAAITAVASVRMMLDSLEEENME